MRHYTLTDIQNLDTRSLRHLVDISRARAARLERERAGIAAEVAARPELLEIGAVASYLDATAAEIVYEQNQAAAAQAELERRGAWHE